LLPGDWLATHPPDGGGACCLVTGWRLIALMMEVAITSETSVNFYQITRRNIQDDSYLHTRRRENLKSHSGNGS
jgi:hypothetical protein